MLSGYQLQLIATHDGYGEFTCLEHSLDWDAIVAARDESAEKVDGPHAGTLHKDVYLVASELDLGLMSRYDLDEAAGHQLEADIEYIASDPDPFLESMDEEDLLELVQWLLNDRKFEDYLSDYGDKFNIGNVHCAVGGEVIG